MAYRYRAVFVAADGTEYVLAQGAPSETAAVEAALAEARRHALIGDEWPHVTEDQLRAGLQVVAEPEPIYVATLDEGGCEMFSKEFFETRRQERLEAKGRALEHITKLARAVFDGQQHVLGVWRLNDDEVVSFEINPDGSLQARRWDRRGGWESWAKTATALVLDEVLTAATSLDADVDRPIDL